MFSSLQQRSHSGEAMRCGGGVSRVLHPGILIESQDGEEANFFCVCRASGHANYPCPKCLVHKDRLHDITGTFEPCTSDSMRSVIWRASQAQNKTAKEKILQAFGLHDIQVYPSLSSCFTYKKTFTVAFSLGFSVFGPIRCELL